MQLGGEKPVLIISHDVVGTQMAGPGIRYYNLARVLAREFPVVLAVPVGSAWETMVGLQVLPYASGRDIALEATIAGARAALAPALWVAQLPALLHGEVPVIVDGYDPFVAETLALGQQDTTECLSWLTQAYLRGDFFICASERQRDWWLGTLEASGRVNRFTYGEDPSLRRLIDVVPFGMPETPPVHTRHVIKGIWPGIAAHDDVILWGGGLWPWLDPFTAVRAMVLVCRRHQDVRLVFPGTRHPNPGMGGLLTHEAATRDLARELGLLNKAVFFGDWVPYADWPNVLLESDVAITLHAANTLEARLAYRSRVLDYLWAGLPVVTAAGDATSDLIAKEGLGIVVDCGDVQGVADGIVSLLDQRRQAIRSNLAGVRAALTWEKVARPVLDFCRRPQTAADRRALGSSLANPFYAGEIARLQAQVMQRQSCCAVRLAQGARSIFDRFSRSARGLP